MTGIPVRITLDVDADSSWISSPHARDLIEACGGKPMWSRRRHAWHCSAATGADVLALADARHYLVSYVEVGGEVS